MKKSFLLHIRLSLAVFVFISIIFFSPTIVKAQVQRYITNAHCCRCYNLFLYGYNSRINGECSEPECQILCPNCRKELGDLNQALERLKGKNRGLKEAYDAFEKAYADALEKYNAALERTFGKEAGGQPTTWDYINMMQPGMFMGGNPLGRGFSGLKGSFGSWFVNQLALESAFAPQYKEFYALVNNGLSIYQSGFTVTPDGAMTWAGVYCDFIGGNEFINMILYKNEMKEALDVFRREIDEGIPMDAAYRNYNNTTAKAYEGLQFKPKAMETAGIILDVIGLILSTRTLINDVWDIIDNYRDGKIAEKQMKPITDSILKNNSMIACINRTVDYINKGGPGTMRKQVSPLIALSVLAPAIFVQGSKFRTLDIYKTSISKFAIDPMWQINEYKLESALNKLKKLEKIGQQMKEIIKKQIYPNVIPWGTKKWKEVKPSVLLNMLKKTKAGLPPLPIEYNKIKPLAESIFEDLMTAITGYEVDYLADKSNNFEIIPSSEIASGKKTEEGNTTGGTDKWTMLPNEKIKGELGRINMSFPAGVDWSFDFYTLENKYVTNRSSFSKHPMFYDLTPGNYNIMLNHVIVGNIPVEKGKEVKLKSGFLNLVTRNPWGLYNESKEKQHTSGNKSVKFALPVGTYLLNFEGKDYRVTIKDRGSVKFELPVPDLSK